MPSPSLHALSLLVRVARRVGTDLDREFHDLGITGTQAAVVVNVHAGDATPQALSRILSVDSGAMTRLIDRLVAKGLAERRPSASDRRGTTLALTDQGQTLAPGLPGRYEAAARQATSPLSPEEVEQLIALLRKLERGTEPA